MMLAGSIKQWTKLKNLINMNFSIEEVVELTSYNAARYIGITNTGLIEKILSNF